LPFVNDVGTANYFGVGAYLRPLEDARRAGVRFATECLAFANVPDQGLVDELLAAGGAPPQDPRWKARSPRDGATGWDFDDVRDHYLHDRFGVDPVALRYAEVARYLDMSRVVTGEVMATTFAEWRRPGSGCGGALIWFLRDLCPGAGWGVLDSRGEPKAAYHLLRRALQPLAVLLVDEGLNGVDAHVVNDGPEPFDGDIEVTAYRAEAAVATARAHVRVEPRSSVRIRPGALLEHFIDLTHAYRFGAPAQDVTVATLVDGTTGLARAEAFHFPRMLPSQLDGEIGLEASARQVDGDVWEATLRSRRLAFAVELSVRDFRPDDNYFHVAPGRARTVRLRATLPGARPRGSARALNAPIAVKVELPP
jgi:beta-mannosidase